MVSGQWKSPRDGGVKRDGKDAAVRHYCINGSR